MVADISTIHPSQRASRRNPCVICNGSSSDPRGKGKRCWGYLSNNQRYAYCSQDDGGGKVKFDEGKGAYVHFLGGTCYCGKDHRTGASLSAGSTRSQPQEDKQPRRFTKPLATWNGYRFKTAYLYRTAEGGAAFQVLRYERPSTEGGKPDKTFPQARPLSDDLWEMSIRGVTRVLYRLPELRAAPLSEWAFVAEGEKCVEALRALGCVATCSSGGAGNWKLTPNAAQEFTGRRVCVIADHDGPDPDGRPHESFKGQKHAKKSADDIARFAAETRVLELPGVPLKGDVVEWIAAGGTKEQLVALAASAPTAAEYRPPQHDAPKGAPWDDPLPLADSLPPVEALDMDMLPAAFRGFVWDIAERLQAPVDYPAVALLVSAGAVIGRRIGIHPKQQDDWTVTPTPWGGLVGPSGWGKSPSSAAAMKPIERLIADARDALEQSRQVYEADKLAADIRKAALVEATRSAARELAKERDATKAEVQNAELERLKAELAEMRPPQEPTARRFRTNDTTVEKLAEILIANPAGILIYRDELMGWLRAMDKQGHESDRAFYNECWGGTTTNYEVDRIGRGSIIVPALCVSVLGGIQPGPLRSYVYPASDNNNAEADGFLQRFQLLVWPDAHTQFKVVDRWPDKEARHAVHAVFSRLASLNPGDYGAALDDEGDAYAIPTLRFSEKAQALFYEWWQALEQRIRSGELSDAFTSHLAKYRSLMPALALLFHLIDNDPAQRGYVGCVGEAAALQAIAWCEYLETHAKRVYASAASPGMERASALLKHIKRGDVRHGATVRDVYVHGWERLQSQEETEEGLRILEDRGWLRVQTKDASPKGGRPSKVIHLHPTLRRPGQQGGEDDGDE